MKVETFEHTCFAGGPDTVAGVATPCGYVAGVNGRAHTMRRIRVTLAEGKTRLFNTVDEVEAWGIRTGNTFDPEELEDCRRRTS